MASTIRVFACFVLLISLSVEIFAQNTIPEKPGTSTISGKVTIEGKPALNVTVLLTKNTDNFDNGETPTTSTTDSGGLYKLEKLQAGRYLISVAAPGFYNPQKKHEWDRGTEVNLNENDTAENIHFQLIRGAVVTGRLYDERGRNVIEQPVVLIKQSATGNKPIIACNDQSDDRGIYRCYGLEPGKYLVGAGSDPKAGDLQIYQGRQYMRAWYPGVRETDQATAIEIKAEMESVGIDIPLVQKKKSYQASGKIIDGSTSRGIPNIMIGSSALSEAGDMTGFSVGGLFSNTDGEFQIDGLTPGKYRAFAVNFQGNADYYGNSITFEIKEENVGDLEMKMEKGAVITGSVRLEAGASPESKNKLQNLRLLASTIDENLNSRDWASNFPSISGVDPLGNMKFKGVRAGKVSFNIDSNSTKEFSILRIERDGAPVNGSIEVTKGEQISGLRLIVGNSNGTIRGEVKIEGGTLPEDYRLEISASPVTGDYMPVSGRADLRGKFLLEGIRTGAYNLSVTAHSNQPRPQESFSLQKNSKTVQVVSGQEINVTLSVSVSGKEEK